MTFSIKRVPLPSTLFLVYPCFANVGMHHMYVYHTELHLSPFHHTPHQWSLGYVEIRTLVPGSQSVGNKKQTNPALYYITV